ncbi:MAG: hypothetical protein EAZ55_05855 [Cytophagales bacterium]|nr:MAG: hypothetical protein EAZ55_05855 [Cytophagales bacterium]
MTKNLRSLFLLLLTIGSTLTHLQAQEKKKLENWVILPIAIFSPETDFGGGLLTMRVFKLSHADDTLTRTSNVQAYGLYTTNNQLLISPLYNIFTKGEKWIINGNIGFFQFPEYYYGIGHNAPTTQEELVGYDAFRIEHRMVNQLRPHFFVGGQYRFFDFSQLKRPTNGLLDTTRVEGYNGAAVSGLGIVLLWDNRNNITYTTKGSFLELTANFHGGILGGTHQFNMFSLDARKFWAIPFRKKHKHIIALQFYGRSVVEGVAPYKQLSELGGDVIMRGYYTGRYRDNHLIAAQAEYRLPLIGRFGAAFFVGVGDVAAQWEDFAQQTPKISYGGGVRFNVNQKETVNIRIDYGLGYQTQGLYVRLIEAF